MRLPLTGEDKVPPAPGSLAEVHHPFDVGWRERVVVLGGVAVLLLVGMLVGQSLAPTETYEVVGLTPVTFVAIGSSFRSGA